MISSSHYVGIAIAALAGVIGSYLLVRADTQRRGLTRYALVWTVVLVAAGVIGASAPWAILALRFLAGAGAVVALTIAALLLARGYRLSPMVTLDVAAIVGAFGTVVATTIVPMLMGLAIVELLVLYWLWQEGRRSIQWQRPRGIVFAEYLVLHGLMELAGSGHEMVMGTTGNRFTALLTIVAGTIFLAIIVPRFLRTREEHRIIADINKTGEAIQPEYAPASPECPHPELWKMYDSMSAEVEVLDFLKQLVITLKPTLVVETGTFMGISTLAIAEGLKKNGFGHVITVEYDPLVFAKAKERIEGSGLASWIECRNQSSLELRVDGTIDLLFSDSDINVRESEVRHFLPQVSPTGMILMHDASSHQKVVREAALRLEAEGLISIVLLPTPRGLVLAQKRAGRK